MIGKNSGLEERVLEKPSFLARNLCRIKYTFDSILEPSLVGLGAVSLALNATNLPLDKFLEGDPKSVLYAAGIGAFGTTFAFVEAKKGYIRKFMHHRFKENLRKVYPRKKHGIRPSPQDPGTYGWLKTTAIASLVYMLVTPTTTILDKTLKHPGSIPSSYGKIKSNVEEILNMDSIYEGKENGSNTVTIVEVPKEVIVEVPKNIDTSRITAIDAQIYRMTSSDKAKKNLGKALYRYQNYCKDIIKEAHEKNKLAELGISYELFAGLLTHESRLDQLAVSYVGAVGVGQLMPWVAKQLGRNSYTYKNYQANLRAYSHKLKKLTSEKSLDELKKLDDRFDRKKNIYMSAEWLARLRRTHKDEDSDITLARYNTDPRAILFAKDMALKVLETDSVLYNEMRHYLQEQGRMFSINVNATSMIIANYHKYGITPVKVYE